MAEIDGIIKRLYEDNLSGKLTPVMLHALVDKIVIHAPDKSTGHRRQQIGIYDNFVGQFGPFP